MKTASRFENFPPYTPIEPFEVLSQRLELPVDQIVKLDANENPYGPSPLARQALAGLEWAHIYPDPENRALRTALSNFTGLPADILFPGAGADELIDLVLRVMLEPGERVLNFPPTFGMYPFDTRLNAGQVVEIQRRADFSLDLPAILKAVESHHPRLLFLTTPNNPDGSLTRREDIQTLLDLPLLVVIDEAYIEFCENAGRLGEGRSLLAQVPEHENLIVLRTFSKWAGLAGLRVGYGAFPAWLMPTLWKAKQPYNVNVAASAAAIASLQDAEFLAGNVEKLRQERGRLYAGLKTIPYLLPFPSQSNFILCQVSDRPALVLKEVLAASGILVRHYTTPLLQNFIRISVGRPHETDALLEALAALQDESTPLQRTPPQNMASVGLSVSQAHPESTIATPRTSQVTRRTGETSVEVSLSLDGTGKHTIITGLPFLDHMLAQVAVHGLFDLSITAQGDLEVDPHHTTEDVALALGQAFSDALGNRQGIVRMASFEVPMDESLARVTLDFSGRSYAVMDVAWQGTNIGSLPTSLIPHFLESFAIQARCNLHGQVFYGRDDHHKAEALFKALGRALDSATRLDPRRAGVVPSSKGIL